MRIAGIVADILGETIVIVVTVTRTFGLRNEVMPLEEANKRPGLMQLLLRDGEFHFLFYVNEPYPTISGSIYFVQVLPGTISFDQAFSYVL